MKDLPSSKWANVKGPLESLDDEVFQLFLQEGERALMDVERRPDEPERREAATGSEGDTPEVGALRLALAQLVDAYPGMEQEFGGLADRGQVAGTASAALELEARPHLLQLVRLGLELFFQRYPDEAAFEQARHQQEHDLPDLDEDGLKTPSEIYAGLQRLKARLQHWTS